MTDIERLNKASAEIAQGYTATYVAGRYGMNWAQLLRYHEAKWDLDAALSAMSKRASYEYREARRAKQFRWLFWSQLVWLIAVVCWFA